MTDKFPMRPDFPMDDAYKAKARERGFGNATAESHFDEWCNYWYERGEDKTPRGWLQCWDNNLKRKAKSAAVYNGSDRSRFERKPQTDTIAPGPRMVWIGGRGFGFTDILAIKRKQSLRQTLDRDEQQALEAWNG